MRILSIDPGTYESAFVVWDGKIIEDKGIIPNEQLLVYIKSMSKAQHTDCVCIEMIASYGMGVGKEVFETCLIIGRIIQICIDSNQKYELIFRQEVKKHICFNVHAKDGNVIQALIDKFGNTKEHGKYSKGTIKNPGFFYGFTDDIWQAFALAVTYFDNNQ